MKPSGRCTLVFPRTSRCSRFKRLIRAQGVGVDFSDTPWNPRQQGGGLTRVAPNHALQAMRYRAADARAVMLQGD
jgi:hypothetical protein